MNKSEFISVLSSKSNISKNECERLLKNAYEIICKSLKQNEDVVFKGFGRFYVKKRNERLIYGGFSKEKKLVPIRNVPCFKIGSEFKNIIK